MNSQPGRPERRVAINSSLLLAAFGLQAVASLVIVGLVARYLGQAGLGRYGFVISLIELVVAFVDLGMSRILVREIAKRHEEAASYTSAVWTLRILLGLVAMGVVALTAAHGDQELWLAVMIYYLAQTAFLLGDVYNSVFHGFQRMEYQFWGIVISQVLMLGFTLGVMWMDLGLVALFLARLGANVIKLIYVAWVSHRHYARAHFLWGVLVGGGRALVNLPAALAAWRRAGRQTASDFLDARGESLGQRWQNARLSWFMLVESLPVGVSLILRSYIWRGGIVLAVLWLGQEQGDLVNGLLYGPLRVVQQMRIVPAAFAAAMLPVFSNRADSRRDEFDNAFAKSLKLFIAISLLLALGLSLLADPVVALLLGGEMDLGGAAGILAVLAWVIVLYFPNWLYGVTLVALGKQRLETLGLALGLVAGVLVAWWGIPRYLAMGVVLAILAAEGAFFVVGTVVMWPHFHWRRLGPSILKIVLACAATGLLFVAGHQLWQGLAAGFPGGLQGTLGSLVELAVLGTAGLALFVVVLLALRTFDQDEMEGIRAMLRLRRRQA